MTFPLQPFTLKSFHPLSPAVIQLPAIFYISTQVKVNLFSTFAKYIFYPRSGILVGAFSAVVRGNLGIEVRSRTKGKPPKDSEGGVSGCPGHIRRNPGLKAQRPFPRSQPRCLSCGAKSSLSLARQRGKPPSQLLIAQMIWALFPPSGNLVLSLPFDGGGLGWG